MVYSGHCLIYGACKSGVYSPTVGAIIAPSSVLVLWLPLPAFRVGYPKKLSNSYIGQVSLRLICSLCISQFFHNF
ncbi:hypothetical protein GDO81_018564 [Engystomops pustulosus]|uniref:Uncharacterized protein n=1 Tax=Engystomops pustulosus TaxID=76066 RepID=A0AAV6ZL01_ENGPU|nr:hypothetical protein GDO81_018564 [Engystomops pustulosus]